MKPYYQDELVTLYHADCRDVLPTLGRFDLLLTDPPYGIEASKKGAHSSIRDSQQWPDADWDNERPGRVLSMAIQSATKSMVWGGNYYTDILLPSSAWLAWIKPEAETGFSLADMELCWTNLTFAARVKHMARRDGNDHPTQKPVGLMSWCLGFAGPINSVLDPFAGSGTTAVAAKRVGLRSVLIEREERYCEIAVRRLSQGSLAAMFNGEQSA